MSLNKAKLVEDLIKVFTREQSEEVSADKSIERLVNGIASAVDVFVKSGQVNVTVSTTGSATAQTGTGTGNIT